jgi:hypothetical protein
LHKNHLDMPCNKSTRKCRRKFSCWGTWTGWARGASSQAWQLLIWTFDFLKWWCNSCQWGRCWLKTKTQNSCTHSVQVRSSQTQSGLLILGWMGLCKF